MISKIILNVIYTNIGRGHPYYLDGVVDYLKSNYSEQIELRVTDVFEISKIFSAPLWKSVEFAYKAGSQGGIIGDIYSTLRKKRNPNKKGIIEKLLGFNIRKYIAANCFPTLVAHPILIPMISDLTDVYYQHGEIAVPNEAIVSNARKIFTPINNSERIFKKQSGNENVIEVSGLCIDRNIINDSEKNYHSRLTRLKQDDNPIGAFFSSGAEPVDHLKITIRAVNSLNCNDYRSVIVCKRGGALEKMVKRYFGESSITHLDSLAESLKSKNIIGLTFSGRGEESHIEAELMPYIDYFAAPSHERTNWAVGLGLPLFILHPCIGTFSPINRQFLVDNGVALDIDTEKSAELFFEIISNCKKDKILLSMAQNGWNKYKLNGFANIAESLSSDLRMSSNNG